MPETEMRSGRRNGPLLRVISLRFVSFRSAAAASAAASVSKICVLFDCEDGWHRGKPWNVHLVVPLIRNVLQCQTAGCHEPPK